MVTALALRGMLIIELLSEWSLCDKIGQNYLLFISVRLSLKHLDLGSARHIICPYTNIAAGSVDAWKCKRERMIRGKCYQGTTQFIASQIVLRDLNCRNFSTLLTYR